MTFTFKLSRRIARLRAPLAVLALTALAACASDDTLAPEPTGALEPSSSPTAAATYTGIPFGYFGQPTEAYGSVFTG